MKMARMKKFSPSPRGEGEPWQGTGIIIVVEGEIYLTPDKEGETVAVGHVLEPSDQIAERIDVSLPGLDHHSLEFFHILTLLALRRPS